VELEAQRLAQRRDPRGVLEVLSDVLAQLAHRVVRLDVDDEVVDGEEVSEGQPERPEAGSEVEDGLDLLLREPVLELDQDPQRDAEGFGHLADEISDGHVLVVADDRVHRVERLTRLSFGLGQAQSLGESLLGAVRVFLVCLLLVAACLLLLALLSIHFFDLLQERTLALAALHLPDESRIHAVQVRGVSERSLAHQRPPFRTRSSRPASRLRAAAGRT